MEHRQFRLEILPPSLTAHLTRLIGHLLLVERLHEKTVVGFDVLAEEVVADVFDPDVVGGLACGDEVLPVDLLELGAALRLEQAA